jgi:hypothetical protein
MNFYGVDIVSHWNMVFEIFHDQVTTRSRSSRLGFRYCDKTPSPLRSYGTRWEARREHNGLLRYGCDPLKKCRGTHRTEHGRVAFIEFAVKLDKIRRGTTLLSQ